MSFISGLVFNQEPPKTEAGRALALAMLARLPHARGRDDINIWTGGPAVMAARAHRTLDLSFDGAQPAQDSGRTKIVAMDGYVANAPALRRELEDAGKTLQGHGDAELVAEGAGHWGLNRLLQKMEGAFAFALWDTEKQALHLVRDRLGARPLYAARFENGFAFASDYRVFATLPGFTPTLNGNAVETYLAWGYVTPPLALWQGVTALPPAHRLMLRPADTALPALETYWSPARALEEIALRDPDDHAASRLERLSAAMSGESIRLDIPFALVDDATPAAAQLRMTLARLSDKPFTTTALSTPDGIALQTAFDALSALPEPVSDPSAPAWYTALRRAAADATVCIAATPMIRPAQDDARTQRLRRITMRVPGFLRPLLPAHMRALAANSSRMFTEQTRLWPQIGETPDLSEPRMNAPAAQMLAFHHFNHRFCARYMPALDRIAAETGVELRLPLADARLLDFGLPASPENPNADLASWMRGPLRPRIQDLMTPVLFQRLGLPAQPYTTAWQDFLAGQDADTQRLWTLATLLAWAARN